MNNYNLYCETEAEKYQAIIKMHQEEKTACAHY